MIRYLLFTIMFQLLICVSAALVSLYFISDLFTFAFYTLTNFALNDL